MLDARGRQEVNRFFCRMAGAKWYIGGAWQFGRRTWHHVGTQTGEKASRRRFKP